MSPPPPIATDDSVALSVCLSVTLMHSAKAVGWNEMPFGRHTDVIPRDCSTLGRGHVRPFPRFTCCSPGLKASWKNVGLYGVRISRANTNKQQAEQQI